MPYMTTMISHIERFDMANDELYWYSILKLESGIDAKSVLSVHAF